MSKRIVFGRVTAQIGPDRYKFELRADGLHVRQHRSRTVQILTFKSILNGCQNSITMKTHKRYYTEQDIVKEIDDTKFKAQVHLNEAARLERRMKEIAQRGDPGEHWMIEEAQKNATKARESATSLLGTRCSRLAAKLAEFRTMQLPGVDNGDRSVAA